jgi:predicted glycoside hydrolase/deacetylase ChbG (UPF0249 family)
MPAPRKQLIVNADDLGYDPEIDRGILEAHRRGIVTSATVMVDTPFSEKAIRDAPATLGLGLHAVLDPGLATDTAEAALEKQIGRFTALRGRPPTHLDSHKHAHAAPTILEAFARVAARRDLPVRALDAAMRARLHKAKARCVDHFLGDAALRPCWTLDRLLEALGGLRPGWSELMCHPGYAPSHAKTSFGKEREVELAALCAPEARALIEAERIDLASYVRQK